jgi:hypothetical protein
VNRFLSAAVLLVCEFALPSFACAQAIAPESSRLVIDGAVSLSADVDPVTAKIAMPIELTVTIDSPVGASLFPPVVGPSLGSLTVVSKTMSAPLPVAGNPDRSLRSYVFTLESLTSGTTTIPSLEFRYQLPGITTGPRKLISPPIEILIASELGPYEDPMAVRELKDVVDPASETAGGLSWLGWITVPIVLSLLALVWHRRSRITPQRWAHEQIQTVRASAIEQPPEREWLDRLAVIMRRYIAYQSGVESTAMSSSELIESVRRIGWPDEAVETLREFFRYADGSKFASGLPNGLLSGPDREVTIDKCCDRLETTVRQTEPQRGGAN